MLYNVGKKGNTLNTENRILTKCEQDLVRTGTVRHPGENRRSMAMKKKILAVCLAAAACVLLSTTIQTKSMQRNMAQKVLRFHVLANSDSREDQALKLKVRDQVGTLMAEKLKDADSLEESERIVKANLNLIENCAADVISAEGYAYPVSAGTGKIVPFRRKLMGPIPFQGGVYEALRVVIGSGEGHNWWCVMYPNLCFANSMYEVDAGSGEKLREVLDPKEYASVLQKGNYQVRFKLLDLLNQVLE